MDDNQVTVKALRDMVARFVAERDWEQFHDPKSLSMSLAIEAAELMEHFQWLRTDESRRPAEAGVDLAHVAEEVADCLAYCLAMANVLDIDLSSSLDAKLDKNRRKYPADQFRGKYRL